MSTTIRAGGLVTKDPDESEVYLMDWASEHLVSGVTITASVWIITRLSGATTGLMTNDNESIPSGSRTTQTRLVGGTLGQKFLVTNRVTTSETPTRTKDRSFYVRIQTK
jgi:hypothetical protein